MRAVQNRSKFPVGLADYFASNKTDLFQLWLQSGRDWQKTELAVKRVVEARNTATKGWVAKQGRELKQALGEEKFKKIAASRKASGLYYEDEDFPGDEDESHLQNL